MENKWLTINDIASSLSVSRTAVINAINRQDLKCVKLGNKRLIKASDFADFLERAKTIKYD